MNVKWIPIYRIEIISLLYNTADYKCFKISKNALPLWIQSITKPVIVSLCHYCAPFTFLLWYCRGRGVCNFFSSVLPQQKLKWQTSVTAWLQLSLSSGPVFQLSYSLVLFGKQGKIHPLGGSEGGPTQKKHGAQFWPLFLYDFSPPPEPALCKLG